MKNIFESLIEGKIIILPYFVFNYHPTKYASTHLVVPTSASICVRS